MADEAAPLADYVATLDSVLTDLNDLWIAFDDAEHDDIVDALGHAISHTEDARIAIREGRTNG